MVAVVFILIIIVSITFMLLERPNAQRYREKFIPPGCNHVCTVEYGGEDYTFKRTCTRCGCVETWIEIDGQVCDHKITMGGVLIKGEE